MVRVVNYRATLAGMRLFDEECAMRSNLYSLALVNTEQFSLVVEKFNFPFNGVMCVVVDVLCECDIRFLSRIQ